VSETGQLIASAGNRGSGDSSGTLSTPEDAAAQALPGLSKKEQSKRSTDKLEAENKKKLRWTTAMVRSTVFLCNEKWDGYFALWRQCVCERAGTSYICYYML
jgi:hypothetical protein